MTLRREKVIRGKPRRFEQKDKTTLDNASLLPAPVWCQRCERDNVSAVFFHAIKRRNRIDCVSFNGRIGIWVSELCLTFVDLLTICMFATNSMHAQSHVHLILFFSQLFPLLVPLRVLSVVRVPSPFSSKWKTHNSTVHIYTCILK